MNIGNNIKYLRGQRKVTQEELAAHLGVSYQAVSKWETNANTPDIAFLPKIAAFFGVTIDALFSDRISDILENFQQIKNDDVIRIVQMKGNQLLKVTPVLSADDPPIEIAFPRNCNDRTQYFKVEIFGHVVTDASIAGDVVCHQDLTCASINGDVRAEGNIKASEIHSMGKLICKNITDCYKLECSEIECAGEIHSQNLTCNRIVYKKT